MQPLNPKRITAIAGLVFSAFNTTTTLAEPAAGGEPTMPIGWIDGSLEFGLSRVNAEFSWNTAAYVTGTLTPNILSELS